LQRSRGRKLKKAGPEDCMMGLGCPCLETVLWEAVSVKKILEPAWSPLPLLVVKFFCIVVSFWYRAPCS
jgi:hypothetical protein